MQFILTGSKNFIDIRQKNQPCNTKSIFNHPLRSYNFEDVIQKNVNNFFELAPFCCRIVILYNKKNPFLIKTAMTKFLVTCILFLISNAANCQDSYVTKNGDTIHGKITNYTQWSKSPVKVDFIDNAGNNTILTP